MTELISVLFLLLGFSGVYLLIKLTSSNLSPLLKTTGLILFFFFWNSEYLASGFLLFTLIFGIKSFSEEQMNVSLTEIMSLFLYVLIFTFLFRKIKDLSIQYIIEQNIQSFK